VIAVGTGRPTLVADALPQSSLDYPGLPVTGLGDDSSLSAVTHPLKGYQAFRLARSGPGSVA
jgi:hypothetical protein